MVAPISDRWASRDAYSTGQTAKGRLPGGGLPPVPSPRWSVLELEVFVRPDVVVLRDRADDVVELAADAVAHAPDSDVPADRHQDVLVEQELLNLLNQPFADLNVRRGV